ELAARELLHPALHREPEVGHEALGVLGVPVLEEPGRGLEHMRRCEVLWVPLRLGDEAHPAQHVGVLGGRAAEDLQLAAVREDLPGEQLHDRGLARTVAAEQAVDAVLLDREVDAVERRERAVALGESAGADHGAGHDWILSARRSPASSSMSMPSFSASTMRGRMY